MEIIIYCIWLLITIDPGIIGLNYLFNYFILKLEVLLHDN